MATDVGKAVRQAVGSAGAQAFALPAARRHRHGGGAFSGQLAKKAGLR
jgi:hypothetical protein